MSARSKSGPGARSASASQFHSTAVERRPRRLSSLISQALSFDDVDAYAAGKVGFLARALVQATMPADRSAHASAESLPTCFFTFNAFH